MFFFREQLISNERTKVWCERKKHKIDNNNNKKNYDGGTKEFTTDLCEWREITEQSDKQQSVENNESMWNHISGYIHSWCHNDDNSNYFVVNMSNICTSFSNFVNNSLGDDLTVDCSRKIIHRLNLSLAPIENSSFHFHSVVFRYQ